MAEHKGITIDFYGNTVDFDKSIDGINKALKLTKNEIASLNKGLKLDSSNVDKQNEKITKLKQAYSLVTEQVNLYKNRLAELGDYNNLTKEQKKEFEAVAKALGNARDEQERLARAIATTPSGEIKKLADNLGEASKNLNDVGDKIENIGKKVTVLSTATAGLFASGVKYNASLEQQLALYETLTGSAEEAERVISKIKEDALSTTFDSASLITANQYLISSGVEADKSMQVILDLANAIAATGGGNAELMRMAQNLQQISNNGKASTMDLRQFGNAGINLTAIMNDWNDAMIASGKYTQDQIDEMNDFVQITEALGYASEEGGKYYGAMGKQAETLNGKIAKLKATFQALLGELSEVLMPVIKDILEQAQNWINRLSQLDDSQKRLITRIGLIVVACGPFLTILGKLIGSSGIGGLLGKIKEFITSEKFLAWLPKVTSGTSGLSAVLQGLMQAFKSLLNPINIIVGALVLAYATNEDFRKTVNGLVKDLLGSLKPAFDNIKMVVETVISAFGVVIRTFGDVANLILVTLSPVLKGLFAVIGTVTQVATGLASIFANTLGLAISAVCALIEKLINWLKVLYQKFADSTFGNTFIKGLQSISGWIGGVTSGIQGIISWFDGAISKGKELLGIQSQATAKTTYTQSYNRGDPFAERSYNMSGGIGLTANIHVNNNGTPIDEQEINRWVGVMVSQLDTALGRKM